MKQIYLILQEDFWLLALVVCMVGVVECDCDVDCDVAAAGFMVAGPC